MLSYRCEHVGAHSGSFRFLMGFSYQLSSCMVQVLLRRGVAGTTLLHHFCWIVHPCPFEEQRALETKRGIRDWLRAPGAF